MNSPDELALTVKGWLEKNGSRTATWDGPLTPETDVVAGGLLDSVRFLDLLLFLENETGKKFDFDNIDDFTTVGGLWSALQANKTEAAAIQY